MKHVLIPHGKDGWERKKRLFEEIIAAEQGPPFKYNEILIIAPSSRMRRTYGRLFLEMVEQSKNSHALVQPEIQTLHRFFGSLYSRLSGPALIDENTRLVLLEGIVKQFLEINPSFTSNPEMLAPSLSSAIADMIEQLSGAGVLPDRLRRAAAQTDFSDKPQVKLLLNVYAHYEETLKKRNLTDPTGMLLYLTERFDPAWLDPYKKIIIDGMHDANAIETHLLGKIASHADCLWLIESPSSDILRKAREFHPMRITADFTAGLGLGFSEDGAPVNASDRLLSEILFSDLSFSDAAQKAVSLVSFDKEISILSALNMREEVSLIAGKVKISLLAGAAPDAILAAFPSLDEYGTLVEEIFTDYGIPYNRALGRQLSSSPVAASLISLLRTCQEDFSGPSLLRIFSSSFIKFAGNQGIAPALDRFMRGRRITSGRQRWLSSLRYYAADEGGADILSGPLNDLFAALEEFLDDKPARLPVWMERLDRLIAWSGVGDRVSLIRGPLNINVQAYKKLREALVSLTNAGRLFPEYSYGFHEWLYLLKKTLMHTRFQVPPEDEGGVQILGLLESMGHAWEEVYLGGLTDGKFPQRLPQNIFLPERTLETLGVRTLEKTRLNAAYHFYRLLLSAGKITLTWPENEGDRPVAPSPFLEELTPLRKAGLINKGIEETSGIQFSLKIEESRSVPELAKSLATAGSVKGLDDVLNAQIEGMAGIKSALTAKPHETTSAIKAPAKREFRVTELDDYLNCPYDYYVKHVLGIAPLEEVTEDISPRTRGSKVHAILRDFYLTWKELVTPANKDKARRLLRSIAERAFDAEADTFRNRSEKNIFITKMAERFLDSEEEFWKQGMRPAYFEHKIESFKLLLSDGAEVEIHAKIDRIDVDDEGNFIIVDYKTGGYPQPKMNLEQDIFQLPLYAVMAREALSGVPGARHAVPLRKPVGLAYYDLAGKNKGMARDVVLYNKDFGKDQPAAKPKASPKSAGEFEQILTMSMDKARRAVEGILSGDFFAAPHDESKCRYCPNETMCEINKS